MPARGEGTTKIYRAMKPDGDGLPTLGSSASKLGARFPKDIPAGEGGLVYPLSGGVSAAPDRPEYIFHPLKPESLGGGGKNPAYELDLADLGPALAFRRDPTDPVRHGFIEPAEPMTFEEYEAAIHATAASWRLLA